MPRHEESLFQRLIQSKLVIVFEVIVLIGLATAVGREMIRRHQIQSEVSSLEAQAAALEKKNVQLSDLISTVSSASYQEDQARLQLGMQKPGETVVTVLGADTQRSADGQAVVENVATNGGTTAETTNPRKWLDYFLKN